jgi:hypothetical protein
VIQSIINNNIYKYLPRAVFFSTVLGVKNNLTHKRERLLLIIHWTERVTAMSHKRKKMAGAL